MHIEAFINEKLAEAHKRFEGMTREQKAVAVARDAIWQLQSGSIEPAVTYFSYCEERGHCRVCAKGALFAGMMNHHKIQGEGDVFYADDPRDLMTVSMVPDIFSKDNWEAIEAAFERLSFAGPEAYMYVSSLENRGAVSGLHSQSQRSQSQILFRIFTNIIHNNGTFNPVNDAPEELHQQLVAECGKTPTGANNE